MQDLYSTGKGQGSLHTAQWAAYINELNDNFSLFDIVILALL